MRVYHFCQKGKKNWGDRLRFGENMPRKNPLNLKNRASLANKAIVSVSSKILQLALFEVKCSLPNIV